MRKFIISMLVGFLLAGPLAGLASAKGKNLVTVIVTGMGESKTEALRDAQRKAVERAAGTKIYSDSKTRDFALVRDTVLARAAGFVHSYEEISKTETEDGIVELKIRAVVSKQGIDDTWGVVTNMLKMMGKPKIMVFIREKVDGQWQKDYGTVQTKVEQMLLKSGFVLVDRNQLKEIDKRDLEAAIAEDKPNQVQAIAKRFGAQIFVTGIATATTSGKRSIYGRTRYIFEAEANVKVFRSDTAQMLSAIPGRATRGVQEVARSAAKQALIKEGQIIAPAIRQDILRFWMDVMEGRGEVQLKVDGITFGQYAKLKKAIKKIKGVKDVTAKYRNKNAEISIEADCNAETLAERMVEALEDKLEITDVSQNVIKASYIKDEK